MARMNFNQGGYNQNVTYYVAGVPLGVVSISIDPVDTPVNYSLVSDTFGVFDNFQVIFGFYNAVSTNNTTVDVFSTFSGDFIEIDGQLFTVQTQAQSNINISSTNLDKSIQLNAIRSLVNAINLNSSLNQNYTAQVIDAVVELGYTNNIFPGDPVWAVKLRAKRPGTQYNLSVYDAILNPNGTIKASFIAFPSWASYFSPIDQRLGDINNTFFFSSDENRGMYLQKYGYGAYIELWRYIDYDDAQIGRIPLSTVPVDRIAILTQDWNQSNEFIFEISKYLKPFIEINLPNYADNLQPLIFITNGLMSYFIRYGEYFNGGIDKPLLQSSGGNDFVPDEYPNEPTLLNREYYEVDRSETRWAGRGAFELNINPAPNLRYFKQDNLVGVEWLTNQPRAKLRRRFNAPEYIYLYLLNNEEGGADCFYRLNIEFTDVQGFVQNAVGSLFQANDSGLYATDFNLYSGDINLTSVESGGGNTRQRYVKLWYDRTFDAITFTRATTDMLYIIDEKVNYNNETGIYTDPLNNAYQKLIWRNPHGVFDSFEFEYVKEYSIDADPVTYKKSLQTDYGQFSTYNRNKKVNSIIQNKTARVLQIESGFVDEAHYKWLQECVASNEWYKVATGKADSLPAFGLVENYFDYEAVVCEFEWKLDKQNKQYNLICRITSSIPDNNISD